MIDAATMNRLAKIRLVQRDQRRAALLVAEERTAEARQLVDRRAEEAVAAVTALRTATFDSPADLELQARAAAESAKAAMAAREALVIAERALEADRHRRIESERDLRGLELARTRHAQQAAVREEKVATLLSEVREGHRATMGSRAAERASRRPPAFSPQTTVHRSPRATRTR